MNMLDGLTVNLSDSFADDRLLERDLKAVASSLIEDFEMVFSWCPPAGARPIRINSTGGQPFNDSTANTTEYRIYLSGLVQERRYSQLVYQLGHELGHIVTDPRRTTWFVESCCEMVSIVMLRRMSRLWNSAPPFQNWADYAPEFYVYADNLIRTAHSHVPNVFDRNALPNQVELLQWLTAAKYRLHETPLDRKRAVVIAEMIRPLFEERAGNWQALYFLGQACVSPPVRLDDRNLYVDFDFYSWSKAVPHNLEGLVQRVGNMFG